jgi:hypothetical protein
MILRGQTAPLMHLPHAAAFALAIVGCTFALAERAAAQGTAPSPRPSAERRASFGAQGVVRKIQEETAVFPTPE